MTKKEQVIVAKNIQDHHSTFRDIEIFLVIDHR